MILWEKEALKTTFYEQVTNLNEIRFRQYSDRSRAVFISIISIITKVNRENVDQSRSVKPISGLVVR